MSLRCRVMYKTDYNVFKCVQEVKNMVEEIREDIACGCHTPDEVEHMFEGESLETVEDNIAILKKCCECGNPMHSCPVIIFQNARTSLFWTTLCGYCIASKFTSVISELRLNEEDAFGAEYWWNDNDVSFEEFVIRLENHHDKYHV